MPRYSAKHKQESHERILQSAAQLFKAKGYVGTNLKEVMEAAGLTIGTFYAHFGSKEDLFCEMFMRAASASTVRHLSVIAGSERDGLRPVVLNYLTDDHRRHVHGGCPFAALLSDLPRTSKSTRKQIENYLDDFVREMLSAIPKRGAASREKLLATFSLLFGAMALSRSVASEKFAQEIVASARSLALKGVAAGSLSLKSGRRAPKDKRVSSSSNRKA